MRSFTVRKTILTRAATLMLAAAIGAGVAVGVYAALDRADDEPAATTTTTVEEDSAQPTGRGLSPNEVYRRSAQAVVEIQAGAARGTGFVIDGEGHVVTNQHVVDQADTVEIGFADGEEEQGRVIATDPSSDLAVIEVDLAGHDVTPLELGSSAEVEVGDTVYAIGNPFGLERSITAGIVSAVDREIEAPNGFTINGAIQTDAPVNQGNSGGPLFDDGGRVIGVVAQIASETGGNVGIGYAVPSDTVRKVAQQLLQDGEIERGYLGVRLNPTDEGVRLAEVIEGGPADDAGLQAGDTVLEAGGQAIETAADIQNAVADRKPGERIEVRIRRGDDTRTVGVELGTRPPSTE